MKAMTATTQKNRHIPHPTIPVGSKPKSPSITGLTIVYSIVKTKRRKTIRATATLPPVWRKPENIVDFECIDLKLKMLHISSYPKDSEISSSLSFAR